MKTIFGILLSLIILFENCYYSHTKELPYSKEHVSDKGLNEYLESQLNYTKQVSTILKDEPSEGPKINLEFGIIKKLILPSNFIMANLFKMFNNLYVLMDVQLYYIQPSEADFALYLQPHFSGLSEIVLFVRATQFENLGILLTALPSGYCQIYGYLQTQNQWIILQTINNENRATDAKFFMQENNLYLIIINRSNFTLAPVIVYKWLGTHFDEIDKVPVGNASSVESFADNNSEIIVATKTHSGNQAFSTEILEFRESRIRRLQMLNSFKPERILLYNLKNNVYVTIFHKTAESIVYWWNGSKLVPWHQLNNCLGVKKALTIYLEDVPIIVLLEKQYLTAFQPNLETWELITKINISENFKNILDATFVKQGNSSNLLLFGMTFFGRIVFLSIPLTLNLQKIEMPVKENNALLQCLTNLELVTLLNQNKENKTSENKTPEKVSQKNRSVFLDSTDKLAVLSNESRSQIILNKNDNLSKYVEDIRDISERVEIIKGQLDDLLHVKNWVLDGKLIIKGGLYARELKAPNIHVKILNNIAWVPDQWLLYSKPQIIKGKVFLKNLVTRELFVPTRGTVFNDLLLLNGNQILEGSFTFNALSVGKMYVHNINNIPVKDVYLSSNSTLISGKKQFKEIKAHSIDPDSINEQEASEVLRHFVQSSSWKYKISENIRIKELNVDIINNVTWNALYHSAFQKRITTTITGNISIPKLQADRVTTKTLSGIKVENIFTATTNQTISSVLEFSNVNVDHLDAKTVNSIDLNSEVSTFQENEIKGPVSINNICIDKNLFIHTDDYFPKLKLRGDDPIAEDTESELLQVYDGKVKIKGSLCLHDINLYTNIFIGSYIFNETTIKEFWLKNTPQEIPVHFEMVHGGTVTHLLTEMMNSIPINDYLLTDLQDTLLTNFIFKNVTVLGNIQVNSNSKHTPDLYRLNTDVVKLKGLYHIKGQKQVQGKLKIERLTTEFLNNVNMLYSLSKNTTYMTGGKVFKHLKVNGDLVTKTSSIEVINGINISDLKMHTMFVNEDVSVEFLKFFGITVKNLEANYLNDVYFNEYVSFINKIYTSQDLKKLKILKNVSIRKLYDIKTINDMNLDDLLLTDTKPDNTTIIEGELQFMGNIFVKNLEVMTVNNVNFADLTERLLYKDWDQNITTVYSFNKIKTSNLFTSQINNIYTNSLININSELPQKIFAKNRLQLYTAMFLNSVHADGLPCDIKKALDAIKNPPSQKWRNIHITGTATLVDEDCLLGKVLIQSANINKNIIMDGKVIINNNIKASNVYVKSTINGVDISNIVRDALYRDGKEQIITAKITFKDLFVNDVIALKNLDIPIINKVNMRKLNESIIHKNQINKVLVRGKKVFFGGLQTEDLLTPHLSGLDPNILVNFNSLQIIPKAYFYSVDIRHNLYVELINDISLINFLRNRLQKKTTEMQVVHGTYYYENMELQDVSEIPTVNKIDVTEVVTDENIQTIFSKKFFTQDVLVYGNLNAENINGFNIQKIYNNSIIQGKSANILGNIAMHAPSLINADFNTSHINGFAIEHLQNILKNAWPETRLEVVQNSMKKVEKVIKDSLSTLNFSFAKYMYLEKSMDMQITIPRTEAAFAIESKGYITLNVMGQEAGYFCGLPAECSCPSQHSLQISPHLSIHSIGITDSQRIFSYDDEDITIHVITNTISKSKHCRYNKTESELTHITWTHTNNNNYIGSSFIYPEVIKGYISGAEFFSYNSYKYIILSRYYDVERNSHSVDCLVFKLSKEKDDMKLIQRIPAHGVRTIHLFHCAQGITLIIANSRDFNKTSTTYTNIDTEIYRFNELKDQFILLRSVSRVNITAVATVVLGTESSIILAQKDQPLEVYKYHPLYDNYYVYQNFLFDSQVIGISVFYSGGVGISDAFLCIVLETGHFHIYSFEYVEGWKLVSSGELDGLQALVPFELNKKLYMFAPSLKLSSLLTVVKQGIS